MKIKLNDGRIVEGCRFKDLPERNKIASVGTNFGAWDDTDMFANTEKGRTPEGWEYMGDDEYEIIEDEPIENVSRETNLVGEFIGWSNGKVVRRCCGQEKGSRWHPKEKGYRKCLIKIYDLEDAE